MTRLFVHHTITLQGLSYAHTPSADHLVDLCSIYPRRQFIVLLLDAIDIPLILLRTRCHPPLLVHHSTYLLVVCSRLYRWLVLCVSRIWTSYVPHRPLSCIFSIWIIVLCLFIYKCFKSNLLSKSGLFSVLTLSSCPWVFVVHSPITLHIQQQAADRVSCCVYSRAMSLLLLSD